MFRQILATRVAPYVLGVFCAGLCVPGAFADDMRPAGASQPAANGGCYSGVAPGDERTRAAAGYGNDFPGLEVKDWVNAQILSIQTRALYRRADTELATSIRRTQAHFEHSKDYQDSITAQQQAYADYTAAREKALATLANDTQYTETLRLSDEMNSRLVARREDHNANHDELLALAQLKLQYASDARAIEIKAIESSADVRPAHDRMVSAGRKVVDMRAAFDDSLHDNAEIAQYRKHLEDARIAMITADAYGYAAAVAADAAYCYSIFLHRNDQGYYAPYGPAAVATYGGGGYSSPYWGR
jgi:hypothetical protein